MEPTGKIPPDDWITAPETRTLLAALTADGQDVRFVGGCVRDAVIKRPVKDIDIATPDRPEAVMDLLARAGIRAIPTGIGHGTVTAVTGSHHYEITTLRHDVESHGRHATVAFTDDWLEDAKRRDFTINTLSADADGNVYDPFSGLDDLAEGHVRFVGIARERIEEDVLRLLRFFRFYAHYGKPPPDADALDACRQMAPQLQTLSAERVRGEVLRILLAPDPAGVVSLMRGVRVLDEILPEAGDVGALRQIAWLETRGLVRDNIDADAIRRLAALLKTDAAGADAVALRLKLSNAERARLVALAAPDQAITPELAEKARRHGLHRLGAATVRDLALLAWAHERAGPAPNKNERAGPAPNKDLSAQAAEADTGRSAAWTALLGAADAWVPKVFPLKGRDAMALGVPHGPRVGDLLDAVEDWWEDLDFAPDRDACLEELKRRV